MDKVKVTKDLANKTLVLERGFAVPKDRLCQAFTDRDLFVQWWGPEGWETTVKEFNAVPGGRIHYCMRCTDQNQTEWFGQESWGLMSLETVNTPDSISYKDYFADADGTVQSGMPVTASTVEFVEKDGVTALITRCQGESAQDIEKLVEMGMVEGCASSWDKLERLLSA